jgi:protein O-mannosyl-transferase
MIAAPDADADADARIATPRGRVRWTRTEWMLAALLIFAVVLAYLPVRHAGFIWDDEHHLTENPCIVGPLGLKDIWTSAAANYFPLVLTSLWLEHAIWALAPFPYHLINVLLHAGAGILLWRVLVRWRIPGAWLAAAIWSLHPVQVESVAWISEMKNTQSAVFYLAAIWLFTRWVESRRTAAEDGTHSIAPAESGSMRRAFYAFALLCAACAILSKASTVMLPVALGLSWWWVARDWQWRHVLWLLPFAGLSAVASGWTIWEQKFHSGALGPEWNQTLIERMIISGKVVWFYLGKLIWPDPLIFVYPRWVIGLSLSAVLPIAAVTAVLICSLRYRHGFGRPVFFAFGYFVALLFPVLGFFDVYFFRYSYVGDHFQYLASMGPIALFAAGVAQVLRFDSRPKSFGPENPPARRFARYGIVAALCLALGTITWTAIKPYFSVESLWRTTLQKNPRCWLAAYNLGTALATTGHIDETITLFEKAIALKPDYTDAHINLGNALLNTGHPDAAVPHFEAALKLEPGNANAHYNLALSLGSLGQSDAAITHFRAALLAQPEDPDTNYHLGCALYERGDISGAITRLQKAVSLRPADAEAHYRLGLALFDARQIAASITAWQRALTLQPSHVGAAESLAWVLATNPNATMRNGTRALELIQHANQIAGRETTLRACTRAAAEAEIGHFDAAIDAAEHARQMALVEGDRDMVAALDGHLAHYRRAEPVRDPAQ